MQIRARTKFTDAGRMQSCDQSLVGIALDFLTVEGESDLFTTIEVQYRMLFDSFSLDLSFSVSSAPIP